MSGASLIALFPAFPSIFRLRADSMKINLNAFFRSLNVQNHGIFAQLL